MKQNLCPRCFEPDVSVVYACQKPGCAVEGKPQLAEAAACNAQKQPICSACRQVLSTRVCASCGYALGGGGNLLLPLSIIGAEGSGKSNYMAVLIHRMRSELCKVYNCALHPLDGDATMAVYEREYHYPLFVQGRCLISTQQEDIEPLNYSLVFSGPKPAGKTCNLTLYDSCGANFDSERLMAARNRSIYNSKGILLLIDPSQLPYVRESLKMQGKPVLEADVAALLARTIHLMRVGLGITNMQQKLDIPIAVVLTKLDTIRDKMDPSSFVAGPSRHTRAPHMDGMDWEYCNLEVQSLIEAWDGMHLIHQIHAQFTKSSFFAISALGGQPGELGQIHRVAPHRVLDPLLWLLWQNGVINCK